MTKSTAKTSAGLEPFMCGIPLKPVEGDPLKDEQVCNLMCLAFPEARWEHLFYHYSEQVQKMKASMQDEYAVR